MKMVRCGAALAVAAVAASCTEPKPKPAAVASATPTATTAVAGLAVAVAPAVKVLDAKGGGVGGVAVTFAVTAGGGTLASTTATSADDGTASSGGWTLGKVAGANTVTASVEGLTGSPVIFTATGTAGLPASIVLNAGDQQTAAVNSSVPIKPSVRVLDANGNPVPNVTVTFTVTGGGGNVTGGSATTTATGLATVGNWTLGPATGANSLSASVVGVASTVAFSATGEPAAQQLSVVMGSGDRQAVMTSAAVVTSPSVVVTSNGSPAPGITVTFTVATGGGSVAGGTVTTDASGVARVGSWTLGPTPGLNTLNASVAGSSVTGNPISFTASGCTGGGANYKLTMCFTSEMTATQRAAFTTAASRWEEIITTDLPDRVVGASGLAAGSCGSGSFSLPPSMPIDDLLIFASVVIIDGPNGVLGSASPCFIRQASAGAIAPGDLTTIGQMRFDVADVANLESSGRFNPVILHEMGHVLGIGTLWNPMGLLQNPTQASGPQLDTHFTGANAMTAFNEIGGTAYTAGGKVPVENTQSFGPGTYNGHWRESVMMNELMSGFLNSGANPLSKLTIQSLLDIGYSVDVTKADAFSLSFNLIAQGSGPLNGTVRMLNDVDVGPLYSIDSRGVTKRIR